MSTMADAGGSWRDPDARRRRTVALYSLGGVAAILVLAVMAAVLLQTSTDVAVRDVQARTRLIAIGVVGPALDDGITEGDPAALERLDRAVRARVLPAGVTRVKIWSGDGEILYADDARLVGRRFVLDADERAVLASGGSAAGVSNLDEPENRFETETKLLEVYQRVRTPDGTPLLLEAYYPYRVVTKARDAVWGRYATAVLGAIGLLAAIQIGLTVMLARRIRADGRDRERLLHQALRASDGERQRIARDLHDGVVQDLAGVSYTIAGAIDELGLEPGDPQRAGLEDASRATRRGIGQLRTLLVDLYPPNLRTAGLGAVLADLLAPAESDGITTVLDLDPSVVLDADQEALAYRVAQESIRNSRRHAGARHISVSLGRNGSSPVLAIVDDGRGFDPDGPRLAGHMGMRMVDDAAEALGACVERRSAVGAGTTVLLIFGGPRE